MGKRMTGNSILRKRKEGMEGTRYERWERGREGDEEGKVRDEGQGGSEVIKETCERMQSSV